MKKALHILLAVTLVFAWPLAAFAADEGTEGGSTAVAEESASFKILSGETDIEKLTDSYESARANVQAVDAKIAEIQVDIEGIEAKLPELQAQSDAGIKQRYIMQSNPLILMESLLSVDTLGDFLKQSDYLEKISKENLKAYNQLCETQEQLEQMRAEQEQARAEADAQMAEAESALRALQDERAKKQAEDQAFAIRQAEVQGGANSVEKKTSKSSSSKKDEKTAKQSKGEKEAKDTKDAKDTAKTKKATENAAKSASPSIEATLDTAGLADGADWHADRDVFIEYWASRIDEYLKGSPLEGQGQNFAAAAWKYGIDPRWSPAISSIESSKGTYCIRPYNAWGWGAADSDPYGLALEWGSWEEAIDAHVKGLAEGYGYTVSMGRARTYCPPNWQRWYNSVLRDMASMLGPAEEAPKAANDTQG